ncbi:Gfo/Idh/MocA family oxidoreductase [Kitasatospora sp. NPDC058162]|uniref:Gfo/Idh/MocA family oxidoreductase n=1 Tax=Kitasatospora sp. NPDC058162 TaxID=3346362 RepID=UPI0036DC793B
MTGRRLRTVVCGTTFGQFYLAALARLPEEFEIAGVLARGGPRSVECARRFGVPLFTEVDQLPEDIDLACVVVRSGVMGGAGTELALRLLGRGIHVLQEQPVHHDDLARCLREARRHGVRYRLGDLYVRLPAVRRFTTAARRLLGEQPALSVDAACSMQVAFPLVHLLGDALGSLRPWRIDPPAGPADGPFTVLTGALGAVPLTLRVQNEVDPADPDNHVQLLHRVTVGTAGGTLSLTDPHGPVLWHPRLHIPDAVKQRFDFDGPDTGHLAEPPTTVLGPAEPPPYRETLSRTWPEAIGADLLALRAGILGESDAERPDQYHLTLTRLWQDVTSRLGYPALRPGQAHRPFPVGELLATVDDPAVVPPALDGLVEAAAGAAELQVRGVGAEQVRAFVEQLDEAVLAGMLLALPGDLGTLEEILAAARVAPAHHGLVERWLATLAERGRVVRDGERFTVTRAVRPAEAAEAWNRTAAVWVDGLGSPEFVDYLRLNAERLPALLSGEQQAALLLFPEGRTELADTVYRETVTARYLNTAVATAVRRLVPADGPPLRVLEVGGGTAATTEAVVRALTAAGTAAPNVDYLFTDVSRFFLGPARERFARHRWLRLGVYDVDRAPYDQGHSPASFDVIVAAGVLNNARDTDATVGALVELLAPGGWLLVTEPTREHLEILTSQAFMMTAPEDARAKSGRTFLSPDQWLDVYAGAGVRQVRTLPAESHVLAPLGQRLFVARKAEK